MFFLYNSLQQTGGEGQTPAFWMNKWPETAAGAGELWRTRRSQWEQFFWHQLWCTVVLSEWNTEWKRDVVWSTYWDGKDAAGYSVCLGLNSVSTINAEPRCGSAGSCGRRLPVDCLTSTSQSHIHLTLCLFTFSARNVLFKSRGFKVSSSLCSRVMISSLIHVFFSYSNSVTFGFFSVFKA